MNIPAKICVFILISLIVLQVYFPKQRDWMQVIALLWSLILSAIIITLP